MAANQDSDALSVFSRDAASGKLNFYIRNMPPHLSVFACMTL
ncbi:MAG: hypothetical protein ACLTBV_11570 [Enterocloster bolteae]